MYSTRVSLFILMSMYVYRTAEYVREYRSSVKERKKNSEVEVREGLTAKANKKKMKQIEFKAK